MVDRDRLSLPEGLVQGKHVLVIDDVRMTGFHEQKIDEYIQSLDMLSVWYLYAIRIDEAMAKKDPTLEARMNKAYVNDLTRLAEVITTRDFLLNSRTCKFIIDYTDENELGRFLEIMDDAFLYELYFGVIGNGYSRMDRYKNATGMLETLLTKRGILPVPQHQER